MVTEMKVISNIVDLGRYRARSELQERKHFQHFRNVTKSLLSDALNEWEELWNELQGNLIHGQFLPSEAAKGFKPACGWPEFLEKMWILRHRLDYAKRFCDRTI